ncbi:uncharacterized protein LOC119074136 [Bradysia coprophila]|uniref:uncharacterized protein LOC119074136 n=1 Tax=Bradysia coprophila TaxID=38358 RepID=UPI00187D8F2F|nr:uncharacterized protein LOC119074136 [Bradysia coprophila]
MGSSSSSLPENLTGGDWTYRLYYYYDVSSHYQSYSYSDSELKTKLLEELYDDNIARLFRFTCKLSPIQVTKYLAHHKFIICRTSTDWYYSIEKNTKGIYIQRGGSLSRVRDYFLGEERSGISSNSSAFNEMISSSTTIKDIVRWIYESSQLDQPYHVIQSNCQDFAGRLHDKFAVDAIDDAALNMGNH